MTVNEAKEIVQKYEKLVNEAREVLNKHWREVFRKMD